MQDYLSVEKIPAKKIKAVFTDLDDTLTNESRLLPEAYQALWDLHRAGFWTVIVSGRGAGWGDCLMRLWPVDAIIFENGAGIFTRNGVKILMTTYAQESIEAYHEELMGVFKSIQKKIPKLKLATDQPFRIFDYAIDFCEEDPSLTEDELSMVLEELNKYPQITYKLSSIHVNYWKGSHTKRTACETLLAGEAKKRGIAKENIIFCGDSPNDEPLFSFFEESAGVANIRRFEKHMKHFPKYVASKEGGMGFVEIAKALLS